MPVVIDEVVTELPAPATPQDAPTEPSGRVRSSAQGSAVAAVLARLARRAARLHAD